MRREQPRRARGGGARDLRAPPDCQGKPWPLETEQQRRSYPHHPIAAVYLSFEYAAAALAAAEREPVVFVTGADGPFRCTVNGPAHIVVEKIEGEAP